MDFNFKQRLLTFLKHLEIGQNAFEKKVGLSNGVISKIKEGMTSESLKKIMEKYPDLNMVWLLTGEGTMLKHADLKEDNITVTPIDHRDDFIAALKRENETLRKRSEKTSPDYSKIVDEVNSKLESVDTNLDALRKTSIAADARQQAGQALLIAIHQGERQGRSVQELLDEWDTEAVKLMKTMQRDTQIGAGKKDKEKSIGRT